MHTGRLQTVRGWVDGDQLDLILPHEHLFTDLRGPRTPGYAQADVKKVVEVMLPVLAEAERGGVTALVECSTIGVGRNPDVLRALAERTPIHILAPTGVYRQAYIPDDLLACSAAELADQWVRDLTEGIPGTTVRAGFIKIAMSDDGPTPLEVRNLQAAASASLRTGAVIASHTIGGKLAMQEMDILQAEGLDLKRFIWVHANAEPQVEFHFQAARRGAYVEYDGIGSSEQADLAQLVFTEKLIARGFSERLLFSHDAGWYNPGDEQGQPQGGMRGFTGLGTHFLPELRKRGIPETTLHQITHDNPVQAFSMPAA